MLRINYKTLSQIIVVVLMGTWYSAFALDDTSATYFIEGREEVDTVIFHIQELQSVDINSDKNLEKYCKSFSSRHTLPMNQPHEKALRKNRNLLIFWKNLNQNQYGFVIANCIRPDLWKLRLNGENHWTTLQPNENEQFKWFTQGRSIGVLVSNEEHCTLSSIFSGDVDF